MTTSTNCKSRTLSYKVECSTQSNFNYKYIICQQKLNSIYSNVIICFILTPFLTLPTQPLLPSPLKLQNFTIPNESLMSALVQFWHLFHVRYRKYKNRKFNLEKNWIYQYLSHIKGDLLSSKKQVRLRIWLLTNNDVKK